MTNLDDIVKEFIVESNENLDQLDRDLVTLEKDPTSKEILAGIFRAIHTIKGTTGFLGFSKLESLAHAGENLLSRLREGALVVNPSITSVLLAMVDAVREMLSNIEATGSDGDGHYGALIESLTQLQTSGPKSEGRPGQTDAWPKRKQQKAPLRREDDESQASEQGPALGEILIKSGRVTEEQVALAVEQQMAGDPRRLGEILVAQGVLPSEEVVEALKAQTEIRSSALSSSNIRVDVGQLDKLMNLVAELVLVRNQILQFSTTQRDPAFLSASQRLNLITTGLQKGMMKTRMQPIDNIWSKLPRVVRDLAMSCGKRVRVEMEGKETELDRTIIEAIKDPLTHIVRNAVDHGIETPDRRVAAGKPAEGRLLLRAYPESGQVNIEISDDGAGLDLELVKRKAMERGLVTSEQAARMSDPETFNLLFLPGFSTAEKVSAVSGRGVGMDVVKTNIEKIGGAIEVHSAPGEGMSLRIKIPLTLAIIPALIVTSAGQCYAIPQMTVLELVRLEGEDVRKGIETIHGAPVYRLRGNLLPLVYLNQALRIGAAGNGNGMGAAEPANIVVLQADDRQFGLVVDEVNDTEEIVVRPLEKHAIGISTYADATIMGDDRTALILDVLDLAHHAGAVSEPRGSDLIGRKMPRIGETREDRQKLLLIQNADGGRMAIPLALVTRLEEFPGSAVERIGNQEVVHYRDNILPLIRVASLLPERRQKSRKAQANGAASGDGKIQVVIYTNEEFSVGLIVERIIDVVEENLSKQRPSSRRGVAASAVIQGRITEVLDVEKLIHASPAFLVTKPTLAGLDISDN